MYCEGCSEVVTLSPPAPIISDSKVTIYVSQLTMQVCLSPINGQDILFRLQSRIPTTIPSTEREGTVSLSIAPCHNNDNLQSFTLLTSLITTFEKLNNK